MKCGSCKDEIEYCEICGELFFTAQRIKCKTFVDVSHNQWRLHAHLNCDPLTGFGKVIE